MQTITASAPGRIDLSGGATDWCGMHTLAMAINLRARATVTKLADPARIEIVFGDQNEAYTTPEYGTAFDLFKAVIELSELKGFKVEYSTQIPKGSGLGGSAPLAVATLFALNEMFGKNWSLYYIAELAQRAETLKLQTVQGCQDQYSAAFGGLIYMDFNGKACTKEAYSKPISDSPYATVESLDKYTPDFHILVAVPKIDRTDSGQTNGSLSERYLNREQEIVASMQRKARLTQEAKKALIERKIEDLYELINQNNEIMQSWGFLSPYNHEVMQTAFAHDALAVKTCGAGRAAMAIFAKNEKHLQELEQKLKLHVTHIFKVKKDVGVKLEK